MKRSAVTSLVVSLTLKDFSAKVYPTNLYSFTLEKGYSPFRKGDLPFLKVESSFIETHSPSEKS